MKVFKAAALLLALLSPAQAQVSTPSYPKIEYLFLGVPYVGGSNTYLVYTSTNTYSPFKAGDSCKLLGSARDTPCQSLLDVLNALGEQGWQPLTLNLPPNTVGGGGVYLYRQAR